VQELTDKGFASAHVKTPNPRPRAPAIAIVGPPDRDRRSSDGPVRFRGGDFVAVAKGMQQWDSGISRLRHSCPLGREFQSQSLPLIPLVAYWFPRFGLRGLEEGRALGVGRCEA
jgi:hypothetical protein